MERRRLLALAAVGLGGGAAAGMRIIGGTEAEAAVSSFDEVYKGRRIQGPSGVAAAGVHAAHQTVLIDGRPLRLMHHGGGIVSVVAAFEPRDDLRAVARLAVDRLGGAPLARTER
ncbi:tyrosinase cofactor [Jidongwangia harbinensis]|uniref:tyrosinase cofactor n=1 Tax=Jidongwangia harbinensis TaxID=2878561 RepID=UPI001CD9BC2E|nr:tyrosinase cofactor [Jidongwangia harbinensis]MCA2217517.1 tyrosinase cofactor [Jidongwangia harbinensis]